MLETTGGKITVVVSSIFSAWLVYKLWKSDDNLFFKVTLSVLAFIPIMGPLMLLFYGITPPRQSEVFQDRDHRRADVYDRWRHVIEEKNPVKRFRLWRDMVGRGEDASNNSLKVDAEDGPVHNPDNNRRAP